MLITPVGNQPSYNKTHFTGELTKNVKRAFNYGAEQEIKYIPDCSQKQQKQIKNKWNDLYAELEKIVKDKFDKDIVVDTFITQDHDLYLRKPIGNPAFGPLTAKDKITGKVKDLCYLTLRGGPNGSHMIGRNALKQSISNLDTKEIMSEFETKRAVKTYVQKRLEQ